MYFYTALTNLNQKNLIMKKLLIDRGRLNPISIVSNKLKQLNRFTKIFLIKKINRNN